MQPWRGRWRLVLAVLICAATGLKLPKRFARVHHSVVVIRPLHATETGGESAWAETRRRRDVLTSHSNVEIHVPMGVDGSFTLHLRRNDQLFSPDFQATVLNTSDTDGQAQIAYPCRAADNLFCMLKLIFGPVFQNHPCKRHLMWIIRSGGQVR